MCVCVIEFPIEREGKDMMAYKGVLTSAVGNARGIREM
jgi:hypothetical protein